jgi:hypothetical protein
MSGWQITDTIAAASALGRRLRELQTRLRTAEEDRAPETTVIRLREDLATTEFERETTIAILNAQLDAARKLNDSQTALSELVKRQVENGSLNPPSLAQAEQCSSHNRRRNPRD